MGIRLHTTATLQVITGFLLVCGLIATSMRLPVAAWGARPRGLTQSRLPTTIGKRLSHVPVGPVTSWFRALTLFDPDMEFYELYNSEWSDLAEHSSVVLDKVAGMYNITTSAARKRGTDKAEKNVKKFMDAADNWHAYLYRKEKQLRGLIHPLLPDRDMVDVEHDIALSVPVKTSSAMKSWFVLESLRTLRAWPGEVVVSTGVQPEHEEDFADMLTLVFLFHRYYSQVVPPTASLKLVAHSHDGGPWSSRYTGIKLSSAPLITLMDNDDYLTPMAIKIRSALLREFPDVDYMVGGFTFASVQKKKTQTDLFENQLYPHAVAQHLNQTLDGILEAVRPWITNKAFDESRGEFNFTKRNTYYLGSLVSVPNLGTQWYRMRDEPYIDLLDRKRARAAALEAEGRLPRLGFEQYAKSTEGLRGFSELRDRQDKAYLESEVADGNNQDWDKRCHNAWTAGRRELYETVAPPIWQWNGEDSAFNFMVYQSGFNAVCVGGIPFGAYGIWDTWDTLFDSDKAKKSTSNES